MADGTYYLRGRRSGFVAYFRSHSHEPARLNAQVFKELYHTSAAMVASRYLTEDSGGILIYKPRGLFDGNFFF